MSKVFLTAEWRNLILITYKIPTDILTPHLPKGIEPDTINGEAFASLVAFDFLNTKVKGVKIPFHVNFPEINLRFYVREIESKRRGVVFIREFVPKYFIELVADNVYNEPYKNIPMKSSVTKNGTVRVEHEIEFENNEYSISLEAENKPNLPGEDSTEHFFKEHSWGYGTNKNGETLVYRVDHPFWDVYPVIKYEHNFDFAKIYGEKWSFLNQEDPYSIILAEGSEIKVYSHTIL